MVITVEIRAQFGNSLRLIDMHTSQHHLLKRFYNNSPNFKLAKLFRNKPLLGVSLNLMLTEISHYRVGLLLFCYKLFLRETLKIGNHKYQNSRCGKNILTLDIVTRQKALYSRSPLNTTNSNKFHNLLVCACKCLIKHKYYNP